MSNNIYARDIRHLQRALRVAKTSKYRWAHGAILASGNSVVGFATNKARNAVSVGYGAITVHAEVAAIKGS